MRLSKTGYVQWSICPRSFKYVFIDKLPYKQTLPMQVGASFHDYARDFFELLDYEQLGNCETEKDVKKVFFEASLQIGAPQVLESYVKNFLSFETKRFLDIRRYTTDPIRYYKPFLLEEKIEVNQAIDDVTLVGIIDRVDITSAGTLAILEYKTGLLNESRVEKELLFYTVLLEHSGRDYPPVTHLIGYSPLKNDYFVLDVNERKKANLIKKVRQIAHSVKENNFPCKEGPLCQNCVGAEICLYATVTREEILNIVQSAAYTSREIAMILEVRRDLVQALLYDMEMEGLVKRAYKGKKVYWWSEIDR